MDVLDTIRLALSWCVALLAIFGAGAFFQRGFVTLRLFVDVFLRESDEDDSDDVIDSLIKTSLAFVLLGVCAALSSFFCAT